MSDRRAKMAAMVLASVAFAACHRGGVGSRGERDAASVAIALTHAPSATAAASVPVPTLPARRSGTDGADDAHDLAHAARRAHDAAMEAGRKATREGDYAAAIAAFDRALVSAPGEPRALAERGYVKLLSRDWSGADADLMRAYEATEDRALSAQIWFNIGLFAETDGSGSTPERARLAFARSNALSPGKAAEAKLLGRSRCIAEIDREPHAATVVRSWSAAWDAMAVRAQREAPVAQTRPETDAAARRSICPDGCPGAGPWVAAIASGRSVHFAVLPVEDGRLALYELDTVEEFMCGPGQDDEYAFAPRGEGAAGAVVHVHARHTIVTRGWEDDWSSHACHDSTWDEADFFLDVRRGARVLRVTESGVFGQAGRKTREVTVLLASGAVSVSGGGCSVQVLVR